MVVYRDGRDYLRPCVCTIAVIVVAGCADAPRRTGSLAVAPAEAQVESTTAAGRIVGRVIYDGAAIAETQEYIPELNRSIDAHTLHVDADNGGVRDVVVYMEGDSLPSGPVDAPSDPPTINQQDGVFVPHVLAVRAGVPVRFISSDPGNHNIHAISFTSANTFNKYFSEGSEYFHTFTADPGRPPVKLVCDLHHWMTAWVYVFDHPFHAVTGRDGSFTIEGVPPGRYTLVAHHADTRSRSAEAITVLPGTEDSENVTITLKP